MFLYKKENEIPNQESIMVNEVTEVRSEGEHQHEFIELVYIKTGKGSQTIDGGTYNVGHGDLLFVSYNQTHSYTIDTSMTFVNILLEPEFLSSELIDTDNILKMFAHSMFAEFSGVGEIATQCVHFAGKDLTMMDYLIDMMIVEYKEKKTGFRSLLQGCVRILFTHLLRKLNFHNDQCMNEVMPDILSFIDENFTEKILLSDIAAKSFYNPVYFSRLIKQHCGMSFSAYIKEKRIKRAAALLKETNSNIETIMSSSGYSDRKLFYRHFREVFGISPGQFRRESR